MINNQRHLLKPPRLTLGDTLGIVAASSPILPSWQTDYQFGKQTLQAMGFQIFEGESVHTVHGWSAGRPNEIANEINEMFATTRIRAIVSATGGFSAIHVLEHLDYALIRQNPKPFIGMSDNTLYHLAMFAQCGLVGFQGNVVLEGFGGSFRAAPPEQQQAILALYARLLTKNKPLGQLPQFNNWRCWREGMAEGRLIGGTLRRLIALAGTPYFPPLGQFDNAILFWDEIGETLYDITLNLRRLAYMGILSRISGMVVGKLVWVNEFFDEIEHPTPQDAILDALSDTDFPILAVEDFGHQMPMLPLPIGLTARLNATECEVEILETAVT